MKKVAVVVAGCGHRDGAEITETVSALITLDECRMNYQCFAPNLDVPVIDHLTAKRTEQTRNILAEAARIARGKIADLSDLNHSEFSALVLPGGFGVALHLFSWATDGANAKVLPDLEKIIKQFYQNKKPIGAICIAPALVAKVLGNQGITVTIGNDIETAQEIIKTGAKHQNCLATDFVCDVNSKIYSTPAYMVAKNSYEVFVGVNKMIKALI